jgi:hypothetical protein
MAEQITKLEAVRRALGALGRDARPAQMQPYIRDHFGIEMTAEHISTSKGDILSKKKAGKKKAGKGGAARRPAAQDAAARKAEVKEGAAQQVVVQRKPASARGGEGAGIPLDDILYVKELVGRFGPGQLHTLIDAFAR